MKIIHITPSYKPAYVYGGTIYSVAGLCEALISYIPTEVLTTTANGKEELCPDGANPGRIDGVKITRFNRLVKDPFHFSPGLLRHMLHATSGQPKDLVIHIHSWWNLTALFSCMIAKYRGLPVILSPRGMLTPYSLGNRKKFLKRLTHFLIGKRLINYCSVHATSEKERGDVLMVQPFSKITVIPNLVASAPHDDSRLLQDTENAPDDNNRTFKLLYLSRIEQKKGLELLLNALAMSDFPWRLTIAGFGEQRYTDKLKALSRSLNIDGSIEWAGHIGDNKKYALMAEHDLLVLFSSNENFANAVAESLTVGTPVAVSEEVGLASFVSSHNLGWVAALTAGSVLQALTAAFNDPEKRQAIRHTAPILIRHHLSTQGIIDRYLKLYRHSL